MSLKRHFLISAAAAVLSHQALGAAKPVIKYEVVENFALANAHYNVQKAKRIVRRYNDNFNGNFS